MFKRRSNVDLEKTDTLIGESSIVEGNIKSQAGIRIEGKITGNIECEGDVTIGEHSSVESNITARNIFIAGSVNGEVSARDKLHILSGGKLIGNAVSCAFIIDEGGTFTGTSSMRKDRQPIQQVPQPKVQNAKA